MLRHQPRKESSGFGVSVERHDIGHVLIGTDDDDAAPGSVQAAKLENVAPLGVGAEHLLIVDQAEPSLSWAKQGRHRIDPQCPVLLLHYSPHVDDGVDIGAVRCEAADW